MEKRNNELVKKINNAVRRNKKSNNINQNDSLNDVDKDLAQDNYIKIGKIETPSVDK